VVECEAESVVEVAVMEIVDALVVEVEVVLMFEEVLLAMENALVDPRMEMNATDSDSLMVALLFIKSLCKSYLCCEMMR
jgi:hypothetical protein